MNIRPISELGISPWPWQLKGIVVMDDIEIGRFVAASDGNPVRDGDDEIGVANCRLIASAPELYDCLRDLYEYIETDDIRHDGTYVTMMTKARSALVKAGGEKKIKMEKLVK